MTKSALRFRADNPAYAGLFGGKEGVQQGRKWIRLRGKFVYGPFPLGPFCLAAQQPGKALAVWQLIQFQSKLEEEEKVTLPGKLLDACGITSWSLMRAAKCLERVGLITINRGNGRSPRFTMVTPPEDTDD